MHELHMLQNKILPNAQVKQERMKAQRQEESKAEMEKMRREEEKKLEGQRKEQADFLQKIEKLRQQIALIKQQNATQQSQA